MKISAAALLFLILAAALGPPTHGSQGGGSLSLNHGLHNPSDCCFSYTSRDIQCRNMADYYETSSRCSKSAVIFHTKGGQHVCADPSSKVVQECVTTLASAKRGTTVA